MHLKAHKTRTDENDLKPTKTDIPMTTFNVCNSILGAGIIGIPFAFREAGFGFGIILLISVAGLARYTLEVLIQAGELAGCATYMSVMMVAFGKPGKIVLGVIQFIHPFIMMVSFQIIIADQLRRLLVAITDSDDLDDLGTNFWGTRAFLSFVVSIGVLLPLSLYRNIAALSKWATVSVLAVALLVVFIAVRLATLDLPDTPGAFQFAKLESIQAIGIFATAFMCHHQSFLLFGSMKNPTEKRWDEVTYIGVIVSLVLSLAIGILGYLTFTGNTRGDILENYCNNDTLMNTGRFLYVISVSLSFPTDVFVTRQILERGIFHDSDPPIYRHFLLTFLLVALSYAGSMTTGCLGIVMELNGLLTAIPMELILPPLLVLKLNPNGWRGWKNLPLYLVLIIGIFVLAAGFVITIEEFISGHLECEVGQEGDFCVDDISTATISPLVMTTV